MLGDRYRLDEFLATGGMGQVWRATDTRLRREVAIKVLPAAFVADRERLARFERDVLAQPGVKCRGREYLRIIYGPDYLEPANLSRLRERNVARKRSLALREYALGVEALTRVAQGEPLWRVHECVFGVLALESEPVDPRL